MAKYYIDTEFIECAKQRKVLGIKVGSPVPTIDLISIGMVCEDGRTLYLLNSECELDYAWTNEWVRDNVLAPIYREHYSGDQRLRHDFTLAEMKRLFKTVGISKQRLRHHITRFVGYYPVYRCNGVEESVVFRTNLHKPDLPVFYGYYSDYDWVVFCQLFGRMIDLPKGFPMFCLDLKQEMERLNAPDSIKPENKGEHNALADALFDRDLHNALLAHESNPK